MVSNRRFLKSVAVPSCNLPQCESCEKKGKVEATGQRRIKRAQNKDQRRELRLENSTPKDSLNSLDDENIELPSVEELMGNEMETEASNQEELLIFSDVQMEVTRRLPRISFCDTVTNNTDLSTLTGIPDFSTLDKIVNIVRKVTPQLENSGQISTRERVVLTFVKLKHNVSYALLAVVFKCCTKRNYAKIISRMLDILSSFLKWAIPWPSKEEILQNMPLCFEDYEDVRVIVDCTEIFIQRPKNLCCRAYSRACAYSQYKSSNTIKFMTGVTPAGTISFVSKCYDGRVSDTAIFEKSGLIDLLQPTSSQSEAIMVDRGFFIDNICQKADVRLVRPPFTRNKAQFSKEEAVLNAKIARARVHVERANQRLKAFKILGDKMPACLVKNSEQISTVICAIVNLSAPILSDDKFYE